MMRRSIRATNKRANENGVSSCQNCLGLVKHHPLDAVWSSFFQLLSEEFKYQNNLKGDKALHSRKQIFLFVLFLHKTLRFLSIERI